jgi:hypothetical protein
MCQKCDLFQAFLGLSPKYLGARVERSDARREVENEKRATYDATPDYVRKPMR